MFWNCPPRSVPSLNTEGRPERFLSCTLPVSRKRFTRRDIVYLFGIGESRNVSLTHSGKESKNDKPGSVRQWTLVALVKKTHPCTSTIEKQLTDWREQVTSWSGLRGLLCSHNDIVCLLIHSNCIELQPPINILIWVARLFDHPVHSDIQIPVCFHN
jgi:hypothetical protein